MKNFYQKMSMLVCSPYLLKVSSQSATSTRMNNTTTEILISGVLKPDLPAWVQSEAQ